MVVAATWQERFVYAKVRRVVFVVVIDGGYVVDG